MILVLVGTQKNSFIRLLNEVQKCIDEKIIIDEVIAQVGITPFKSINMKTFDFIPTDEMNNLLDRATLIITHAGVGSIIEGLKRNKKVIAVPRYKEFNEHVNNHQLQIAENFDAHGYIKVVTDINLLGKTIKEMDEFVPNKYETNNEKFIKIIEDYIDNN